MLPLLATSSTPGRVAHRWWCAVPAVRNSRRSAAAGVRSRHLWRYCTRAASLPQQQVNSSEDALGWLQLHKAAQVAFWSGLCYHPAPQLPQALQQQHLTLVAQGRNEYTSWYIADGVIPHETFVSIYSSRQPRRPSTSTSTSSSSSNRSAAGAEQQQATDNHDVIDNSVKPATDSSDQKRSADASTAISNTTTALVTNTNTSSTSNGPHSSSSGRGSGSGSGAAGSASPGTNAGPGSRIHPGSQPATADHSDKSTPGQQLPPTTTTPAAAAGAATAAAAAAAGASSAVQLPAPQRQRFVFFRGVQWGAPEVNSMRMSQLLAAVWPTPFAAELTQPRGALVAHTGVAQVAVDLFDQLRPYLDQGNDAGLPLCFAGHSLGGSIATLVMALHTVTNRRRGSAPPSCYTFGSPTVLAHAAGGGGHRVLEVLGLAPNTLHNYALENDPVPRALLSVDPTYQVLQQWGAVRGVLELRERLLGAGAPLSPGRFLYEAVGEVYLIKWTSAAGTQVVPLNTQEMLNELSMLGLSLPTDATTTSINQDSSTTTTTTSSNTTSGAQTTQQQQQGLSPAGLLSWLASAAPQLAHRWPWDQPNQQGSNGGSSSSSGRVGQRTVAKPISSSSSSGSPTTSTPTTPSSSSSGSPTTSTTTTPSSSSSGSPTTPRDLPAIAVATPTTTTTTTTASSTSSSSSRGGHVGVGVNQLPSKQPPPGPYNPAAASWYLLNPWRSLQAWLDHHHGSYAQELETAAVNKLTQQLKRDNQQQQQQGQQQPVQPRLIQQGSGKSQQQQQQQQGGLLETAASSSGTAGSNMVGGTQQEQQQQQQQQAVGALSQRTMGDEVGM